MTGGARGCDSGGQGDRGRGPGHPALVHLQHFYNFAKNLPWPLLYKAEQSGLCRLPCPLVCMSVRVTCPSVSPPSAYYSLENSIDVLHVGYTYVGHPKNIFVLRIVINDRGKITRRDEAAHNETYRWRK